MDPIPGNHNSSLRGETGLRLAAMVVIEELGENAAVYAATRAIILQKQGDEIGASTWRRVAPVIEEMQRKKAPVLRRRLTAQSARPEAPNSGIISAAAGSPPRRTPLGALRPLRFPRSLSQCGDPPT